MLQIFVIIHQQYCKPYESAFQNLSSFLSEITVLTYILHLRIFTDWVPSTQVKYNTSLSLMIFICLEILFQVVIVILGIIRGITLFVRRQIFIRRIDAMIKEHKRKMEELHQIRNSDINLVQAKLVIKDDQQKDKLIKQIRNRIKRFSKFKPIKQDI